MKQFYLIIMLLGFVCLTSTSCATHILLDASIYPSHDYWQAITDNENVLNLCSVLENKGYTFDEFYAAEAGLEVTYPNGDKARYPLTQAIEAVLVTDIARDYDNPNIFLREEFERLQGVAQTFCYDYQEAAEELHASLPIGSVLFWDYVDGVGGGFTFSETCELVSSYGWSAGSYANRYEIDPDTTCPAGRVSF